MSNATKVVCLMVILVLASVRFGLWFASAHESPGCIERAPHDVTLRLLEPGSVLAERLVLETRVLKVHSEGCRQLESRKLRLVWYDMQARLSAGTQLHAEVNLSLPAALGNPGGFNYARWLRGNGFVASGYVKHVRVTKAGPEAQPRLHIDPKRYVHADLLNAMLLGRSAQVSQEAWQVFRATGTIHLMVISGLHVGVFFGFVYLVVHAGLRLLPWRHAGWVPRRGALLTGLFSLVLLVVQVGADPPVVRAAMMTGGVACLFLLSRRTPWWHLFTGVLLCAVVVRPEVTFQQGFWLSFSAVGALLYVFAARRPLFSTVTGLLCCQVILLLMLTPLLGVILGEVPVVSPLANLLVVPLVTGLTIPAGMSGLLLHTVPGLSWLSVVCLYVADASLGLVVHVLQRFPQTGLSLGYFDWQIAVMALIAGAIALSPAPAVFRLLALCGWLPVMLQQPLDVPAEHFRIQVVDVGQGSAAIIDTHSHRLLVDTGASFRSGFNMLQAAVVPLLRVSGPNRIDRVLISHTDNDHAGGLSQLRRLYPQTRYLGADQPCSSGEGWRWDGVSFQLLVDAQAGTSNDASCTLVVSNGRSTAYFSGDISSRVERRLLAQLPRQIDWLLAPHHGSISSSAPGFVSWLRPAVVVFSTGRNNRYGHPRAEVVERYLRRGARVFNTAEHGAVIWSSDLPDQVKTFR
ncbi:MAG: DNA internalization-related competence protein ComEC/Rec2 [bacterium]